MTSPPSASLSHVTFPKVSCIPAWRPRGLSSDFFVALLVIYSGLMLPKGGISLELVLGTSLILGMGPACRNPG